MIPVSHVWYGHKQSMTYESRSSTGSPGSTERLGSAPVQKVLASSYTSHVNYAHVMQEGNALDLE